MKTEYVLDLATVIDSRETALVGRDHGEDTLRNLRKAGMALEKLENENETIRILVPSKIVSINKSFFLGMFESSIQRLGKDAFAKRYLFETTEHIANKISRNIDAALLTASQGEILDVAE